MFRSFAIVPAAGGSARMGRPKLLLPLGGYTVIERVLAAWTASAVTRTVVVVRRDDQELSAICREFAVDVVTPPLPPPDMRSSVQAAIEHIGACYAPHECDAWLLAPADLPRLSPRIINRVLEDFGRSRPRAVVPVLRGRRGHPAVLPWPTARRVRELASQLGVNSLIERLPVRECPCDEPGIWDDLDTPLDYRRIAAGFAHAPPGCETGPNAAGF